ncbi:MAG: hypothetical protein IH950_16180 [Bacteroidetes bacterium]|nr:hypothetical protein [Bacteroidota bacterium]
MDNLERIYDVAVIVLIISALLVPISTLVTWQVNKKINAIKNSSGNTTNQRLDEAEAKIGETEQEALNFKKEAEALKSKYDEVVDELDANRKELEETKQKLAPRTISKQQKEQFISFLVDKPKLKFWLSNAGNNEESVEFSKQIFKLLIDAGYKNIGGISTAIAAPTPKNISFGIHSENSPEVMALLNAFTFINIKYDIIVNSQIPANQINIIIGAKGL